MGETLKKRGLPTPATKNHGTHPDLYRKHSAGLFERHTINPHQFTPLNDVVLLTWHRQVTSIIGINSIHQQITVQILDTLNQQTESMVGRPVNLTGFNEFHNRHLNREKNSNNNKIGVGSKKLIDGL